MSPYVDLTFYRDNYLGESVEDTEFNRMSQRASEVIDMITNGTLKQNSSLMDNEFISNQVKLATCAQLEYFVRKGGYTESMSGDGEPQSVSIDSFSYSIGSNRSNLDQSKQDISQFVCSSVYGYLQGTGLLYKGVNSYGY